MRKWNAVISAMILVLFVVHMISGGFVLAGFTAGGSRIMQILARAMATLVILHILIGIVLTVKTLAAQRRAGKAYFRENAFFWARRFSGAALVILMLLHVMTFMAKNADGAVRLSNFGTAQLIESILLVLALIVHIVSNIRPLMISLGITAKQFYADILLIFSVILLLAAAAFVVYYFRWNVIWLP